eukprot:TRINITY_DN20179_c2_g1_i1.p1 TRINITY_DN20179_c2_g1~~TRINITY_DN20179_c2_g1_i1.p1  ORF type:complete len:366 (+),score=24.99 TRINITY_DN20179_c2_g1_i1:36-1100(+)
MIKTTTSILITVLLSTVAAEKEKTQFSEVFVPGEGGYPCIRIPVLLKTPSNKLLAFAECRRYTGDGCYPKTSNSTNPDRDICMKHSNDLGKTWSPLRTIVKHGLQPTPVYSLTRKTLILQYGDLNLCVWEAISTDEGTTWTTPKKLSYLPQTAVGPGPMIETKVNNPGRLIFMGYVGNYSHDNLWFGDENTGYTLSQSASNVTIGMGEAAVTELPSGVLMANIRNPHLTPCKCRATSISRDGGVTWSEPIFDELLIDPMDQAALITLSDSRILFSNDADSENRTTGTLRLGREVSPGVVRWEGEVVVNSGAFAYSSPAELLSPTSIGLLWETTGPQCLNTLGNSCRIVYSVIDV